MRTFRIMLFFIPIMFALGLTAQSITVISPNGGEKLSKDSETTIRWSARDIPAGGQFKITLWRGDSQVGVIAADLPGSMRSQPWRVGALVDGANVATALGYKIKVKLKGEPFADESDRTFEIKDSPGYDLSVRIVRFEITPVLDNLMYRWRVKFRFGVHASGAHSLSNIKVRWRLLENGTVAVGRKTGHEHTIPSISPGKKTFYSYNKLYGGLPDPNLMQWSPMLKPGCRYVLEVVVDPGDVIKETREDNNTHSCSVTLPD